MSVPVPMSVSALTVQFSQHWTAQSEFFAGALQVAATKGMPSRTARGMLRKNGQDSEVEGKGEAERPPEERLLEGQEEGIEVPSRLTGQDLPDSKEDREHPERGEKENPQSRAELFSKGPKAFSP